MGKNKQTVNLKRRKRSGEKSKGAITESSFPYTHQSTTYQMSATAKRVDQEIINSNSSAGAQEYSVSVPERRLDGRLDVDMHSMCGSHTESCAHICDSVSGSPAKMAHTKEVLYELIAELQHQLREKNEEIVVLKHQMEIWYQDFTLERNDRVATKSKVIELEKKLNNSYTMGYRNIQQGHIECDTQSDQDRGDTSVRSSFEDDEDIIDSLLQPSETKQNDQNASCVSNNLVCPKCDQCYTIDNHIMFLDHIEICCSC